VKTVSDKVISQALTGLSIRAKTVGRDDPL